PDPSPSSPDAARADAAAGAAAAGAAAAGAALEGVPTAEARAEFVRLFEEFAGSWSEVAAQEVGTSTFSALRAVARRNFSALCEMDRHGMDVSDLALLRLLPHDETPAHRA